MSHYLPLLWPEKLVVFLILEETALEQDELSILFYSGYVRTLFTERSFGFGKGIFFSKSGCRRLRLNSQKGLKKVYL